MSSTEMKSYLSLIPISAKVRRRQNRMTILCIVIAVFLVSAIFSVADMMLRTQPQSLPHRRMLLHFRRIATSTLPLRKTTLPEINVPHW